MAIPIQGWLNQLNSNGIDVTVQELLGYQQARVNVDLSPKRAVQAKLAGSYLARSKGRGMEFDEARHYQPGDDIRSIDWRVTARTGKTHTKLYREEKERPVLLVTDLSQAMRFGSQLLYKSVQAAHLSALLAWAAIERGDRVGALLFTGSTHREFRPKMRAKAALALLGEIVRLHNQADNGGHMDLTDACARLRRMAHPGAKIAIITEQAQVNATTLLHLRHLTRHCEVTVYSIYDPLESQIPNRRYGDNTAVTDGNKRQIVDLNDTDFRRRYQSTFATLQTETRRQLRSIGVEFVTINAGLPLSEQWESC